MQVPHKCLGECFDESEYNPNCRWSAVRCDPIYHYYAPQEDGLKAQTHPVRALPHYAARPELIESAVCIDCSVIRCGLPESSSNFHTALWIVRTPAKPRDDARQPGPS